MGIKDCAGQGHTSLPGSWRRIGHFTYRIRQGRGQNRQDGGFRNHAARMPLGSAPTGFYNLYYSVSEIRFEDRVWEGCMPLPGTALNAHSAPASCVNGKLQSKGQFQLRLSAMIMLC